MATINNAFEKLTSSVPHTNTARYLPLTLTLFAVNCHSFGHFIQFVARSDGCNITTNKPPQSAPNPGIVDEGQNDERHDHRDEGDLLVVVLPMPSLDHLERGIDANPQKEGHQRSDHRPAETPSASILYQHKSAILMVSRSMISLKAHIHLYIDWKYVY